MLDAAARTYRPPQPGYGEDRCRAPMTRRSGPCGRPRTCFGYLTDWATGEKTWLAACTRHDDWSQEQRAANEAARPAHPPLPAANHGGVLARHFPELD